MVGKYIVIEGLDMCGKTTMQNTIVNELIGKGMDVMAVSEPYLEEDSNKIMEVLLSPTNSNEIKMRALAENREFLLRTKIIPMLNSGVNVISSRSFISSLVYQNDDEFSMDDILDTNLEICGANFRAPDAVIYMPVSYETYIERTKIRGAIDSIEVNLKSKEYFDEMTKKYKAALEFAKFQLPEIRSIITTTDSNEVLKSIF